MDRAELRPRATAFPPAGRRFFKYDALGNDYIVLDPADWPEPPTAETIRRICDRHHGVGSDGILWGPTRNRANVPTCRGGPTFALRLFNPDGSEFEKSGNGLRIFARYLWDRGLPAGPEFDILTPGGAVTAHVLDAEGAHIAMDMGRLSFLSTDIGVTGPRARWWMRRSRSRACACGSSAPPSATRTAWSSSMRRRRRCRPSSAG